MNKRGNIGSEEATEGAKGKRSGAYLEGGGEGGGAEEGVRGGEGLAGAGGALVLVDFGGMVRWGGRVVC